jgi:ABC-type transporter Mla subunit MlaD
MSRLSIEWATLLGMACLALMGLQWWWQRRTHGRSLARQQHRHVQQLQNVSRNLDQAKRQIEQLQHDLAAARLQLKRVSSHAVIVQQQASARAALQRTLDEASDATSALRLPPDGFADTLPSPQYPEYLALLTNR